jgi:hypothetical protein
VSTLDERLAVYVRAKVVKGGTYYQVVEGYRDEAGRVRHRNIISLGRNEEIDWAIEECVSRIRSDQRRLRILEEQFRQADAMPGWGQRKTARLRARLTRHKERRAALMDVAKRF